MLEKQRIHLEELIDYYVERCLEAAQHFGTDKAGMAMSARDKAKDDIREYLSFIQSYVGTLCAMTPGAHPTKHDPSGYNHPDPMDYIIREEG